MRSLLLLLVPGLLLGGCASRGTEVDSTPRIGEALGPRNAPDAARLPVPRQARPAEADPEAAIENYRALLALEPDETRRTESMRRLADLQVQQEDARGNDQGSEAALRESVSLYRNLLDSRHGDPKNDQILYQLARAYQNLGETGAAVDTLAEVVRRHPDSPLVPDARFRRAELLFFLNRHREALAEYERVLALGPGGAFFDASEYKAGWSHYKLGQFEEAIAVFLGLLTRDLPPGEALFEVEPALARVDRQRVDFVREGLRIISLSFGRLDGGDALNRYLQRRGDPAFYPLLYNMLATQLGEQGRHADAARVYVAFVSRYPRQPHAPEMQDRAIAAHQAADDLAAALQEKERYALAYAPGAAYWGGQGASPAVLGRLRVHLGDLARQSHARAQQAGDTGTAGFLAAAGWYQRILELYPQDPQAAELQFLRAESLASAGRPEEAIGAYARAAYAYPGYRRAADAAYAGVLLHARLAASASDRTATLRRHIDASRRFAASFAAHPQVPAVLTLAAEHLHQIRAHAEAVEVAAQVLALPGTIDRSLQRAAWRVSGDAHFALANYARAEAAYTRELALLARDAPERGKVSELLAASVYRQGETARDAADLQQAAVHFLRVAPLVPGTAIAATADYDGASSLYDQQDWPAAAAALDTFRTRYPAHPLNPAADKQLALAYQNAGENKPAAAVYARIAQRADETPAVRREAAWLSATLLDASGSRAETVAAFEAYLRAHPQPLPAAQRARYRLMEIAREQGNRNRQREWLQALVSAERGAPAGEREPGQALLAARAALMLGQLASEDARQLRLRLPIEQSLPAKQRAMEAAITALNQAVAYGFAEVTTTATFELGRLYQEFGRALMDSERPRRLRGLELEQYDLLLEEQAYPFEEKAIQTHLINLRRVQQGVLDSAVRDSYEALSRLAPGIYGKREKTPEPYDALH